MAGEATYSFGECTWYVAHTLAWIPGSLHDGGDWAANAAARGYRLTMVPTVGSAVCYGRGDGYSTFGHVAVVIAVYSTTSFLVSEMNFVAWDQVDQRVSNMHDVVAFILPPGAAPGAGLPSQQGGGAGSPDQVRAEWGGVQDYLNNGADNHIWRLRAVRDRLNAI